MAEMTFQEIIEALNSYWSRYCVIQQPYDLEVGAGTMNPATALRVLGRNHGMLPMWSLHAGLQMADMGKTPTGCSITISTR